MGVVGAIGGALIQASAAKKAAKAQTAAANQDIAFQKETRDIVRGDLSPYRTGGQNAYNAYQYELGLGPAPMIGGTAPTIETFRDTASAPSIPGMFGATSSERGGIQNMMLRPQSSGVDKFRVNGQVFNTRQEAEAYANANMTGGTPYQGFQKSQDYLFGLGEGTSAIEASAAARGGLFSGATMRDLNQFGQDYGSQRRGEYLNRLAGVADTGLNAANMSGNASMAAAGGVSNALSARGNAAAAGAVGVGNAINGGIGNALGAWQYQKSIGGNPWGLGA